MCVSFLLLGCFYGIKIISYSYFSDMIVAGAVSKDTTVVDVRSRNDWLSGHIQDLINVEHESFVDGGGDLINDGEAFSSMVTDKNRKIVIYGSESGEAEEFAEKGGLQDWHDEKNELLTVDEPGLCP